MSSSPDCVVDLAWAAELKRSLERTLNMSFQLIALETAGWRCVDQDNGGRIESVEQVETNATLNSVLPADPDTGKAFVRPSGNGRFLVGIPLAAEADKNQDDIVFAVGEIDRVEKLLENFAELAFENESQRRQLEEQDQQLEKYTDQVIQDFEERSWLEELIGLETFDLTNDVGTIATRLLKLLQPIVHAVELLFVPSVLNCGNMDEGCPALSAPDHWIGRPQIDRQVCRRLIERYRQEAWTQPVVKTIDRNILADFPGVNSFGMVSVSNEQACIGWLLAINRQHDSVVPLTPQALGQEDFGTQEIRLLNAAATALAAHNRGWKLFHENKHMAVGAIRSLASAVDAKDPYTRGHSHRVGMMAELLGEKLQLPQSEQDELMMMGLLHDIGKIGVPDAVLLKPGKLTEEEFDLLKKHPEIGYQILLSIEPLRFALPGVLHHHESYNGRGYPAGLEGDEIPRCGRILAIADAYDAMTSDRPYRKGMSFEKSEAILGANVGPQWDPEMLTVFLENAEEFRCICRVFRVPDQYVAEEIVLPNGELLSAVAGDGKVPAVMPRSAP